MGRITPEKQQDKVLWIAKKLRDIKFYIIGSVTQKQKPFLRYLQNNKPKNVEIYPNAPLELLLDLMSKSKTLLHTMRGEHFGIAVAEGMSGGLIPVVWNYGGPTEFTPKKYQFGSWEEAVEKVKLSMNAEDWEREMVHDYASKFSETNFKIAFAKLIYEMIGR